MTNFVSNTKIVSNYVSSNNQTDFDLYMVEFDVKKFAEIKDKSKCIFYIDYFPLNNIADSFNKLSEEELEYIAREKSKILIITEGFCLFNVPEIFQKNIDISNVAYWNLLKQAEAYGIKEEQFYILSNANGFNEEVKLLMKNKIKFTGQNYKILAKILCLPSSLLLPKKYLHKVQDKKIKKLYASLSNGRPALHRYNLTKMLDKNGLLDVGKVSMVKMLGDDPEFNNKLPFIFDGKHNLWRQGSDENYIFNDIFVWISNETYFDQKNFTLGQHISEKTFKAIQYKTPFIINGDRNTLAYLKHLGFKTFEDFWDESYDSLPNIEDRQEKIIQILKSFKQQNIQDLYRRIIPILEYNFNHLVNTDWSIRIKNFLDN